MDQKILDILNKENESNWLNSFKLSEQFQLNHDQAVGALKSLEAKNYLILSQKKNSKYILTKEGETYAKNGMPEFNIAKLLNEAPEKKSAKKSMMDKFGKIFRMGLQNGIKKKMFHIEKDLLVLDKFEENDQDSQLLEQMSQSNFFDGSFDLISKNAGVKMLKKRKLFKVKNIIYFLIKKGECFSDKIIVKKADLTMNDINKGTWKDSSAFKAMNLKSKGKELERGGLHPLMKMKTEFRKILLEMGFKEMETNKYVESSFWNFDSLLQPQQHPARDSHDTFFLKNPEKCTLDSKEMKDYMGRVKSMHEKGFKEGTEESYGWKYDWSIEEARKNILRTHTTAVSSRYLKKIADEYKKTGKFVPVKLFSIDRVFRNETLDQTHLAEFHQVEGLIVGKKLGLPQLKCFIRDFFNKIGMTKIKFKPAYNPYTEPSMEIFVYHPLLKKTIEIGNSGVFRPEMLRPMGLPKDTTVIAWGLSLERPAMINFNCGNIRELLGYKVNFKSVRNAEIIRF